MFEARARGVSLPEMAKRTKHSISSIMRWESKYGHEVEFMKLLLQNHPDLRKEIGFEVLYPTAVSGATPSHSTVSDEDLLDDAPHLSVVGHE
jgi:hypothetical protein